MKEGVKELFKKFEEAEKKVNELDKKWDEDPENEELEKAWDIAYKEERKALDELANVIVEVGKLGDEKFNKKMAYSMIFDKREELRKAVNKL